MLAYEMDGAPISRPHGAPLRLVMPQMYGYKSVKWVNHIELGRTANPGTGSSTATTPTRGSGSRMASPPDATPCGPDRALHPTERALHWMHASAFFALLATGLILYLPALSTLVSRRNLVKNVHIWVAVAWAVALVVIFVVGNRRRLAEDWREIETIDRDDRRWLRGRRAPQGRFNAGQKINALLTVAFALLFALSGFFLWLGERDHRFIFAGTGTVHDVLTFLSVGLLVGHLYLALIHPSTRHALRGMTTGEVDEDWARKHHAKWVERLTSTGRLAALPGTLLRPRSPAQICPISAAPCVLASHSPLTPSQRVIVVSEPPRRNGEPPSLSTQPPDELGRGP